jgi:hypothetical protein
MIAGRYARSSSGAALAFVPGSTISDWDPLRHSDPTIAGATARASVSFRALPVRQALMMAAESARTVLQSIVATKP